MSKRDDEQQRWEAEQAVARQQGRARKAEKDTIAEVTQRAKERGVPEDQIWVLATSVGKLARRRVERGQDRGW